MLGRLTYSTHLAQQHTTASLLRPVPPTTTAIATATWWRHGNSPENLELDGLREQQGQSGLAVPGRANPSPPRAPRAAVSGRHTRRQPAGRGGVLAVGRHQERLQALDRLRDTNNQSEARGDTGNG